MQKPSIHYNLIKILTSSDLSQRRIPYMMIDSRREGPVIWLTGCMHGDEIGGTVIIHEIFKQLRKLLIRGSVHAFPLMNPIGFENATRNISISNEDLNRAFPGRSKGSFAQRIARQVFSIIVNSNPSLVLDLHNDWNKSVPYVLIDPIVENHSMKKQLMTFADYSGLIRIQDTEVINKSLSYNLINQGIPALTIECGESLIINERNVEYGLSAITSILMKLGMVEERQDYFRYIMPEPLFGKSLTYSSSPLCPASGIIRFIKKPGDLIKRGDKIARIYNAFGKITDTIIAENEGIVLGHTDYAIAYPGAQVMAFGIYE